MSLRSARSNWYEKRSA